MKEKHHSKREKCDYEDDIENDDEDRISLYSYDEDEEELEEEFNSKHSHDRRRHRGKDRVELLNESWGRKPSRWDDEDEDW